MRAFPTRSRRPEKRQGATLVEGLKDVEGHAFWLLAEGVAQSYDAAASYKCLDVLCVYRSKRRLESR